MDTVAGAVRFVDGDRRPHEIGDAKASLRLQARQWHRAEPEAALTDIQRKNHATIGGGCLWAMDAIRANLQRETSELKM
jgi:hypothetical protein